jgi:SAM-dependent methyltransferase
MLTCHLCLAGEVRELPEYASLTRVTSDCKPWPAGGHLGVCARCGTVQKFVDAQWTSEIRRIYSDYTIYFQAGGAEQAVFLGDTAEPTTRSQWLVDNVIRLAKLGPTGRLLDIGCGNGAFLQAFSNAMPGWRLVGTELSDSTRAMVEKIPGVEMLHTAALTDVPGRFDVIALVHVLEHIARPLDLLATAREKLNPGGVLFVQVPDGGKNAFDLLIADHVSHFTPHTARALLDRAGYQVFTNGQPWVAKEISMLASFAGETSEPVPPRAERDVERVIDWLLETRAAAWRTRDENRGQFGLFGSSIAATWLAHELACGVAFFVDEDPSRHHQRFMGQIVLAPGEVPAGSSVYVGIGGGVAEQVAGRLSKSYPMVRWVPSPPTH